MDKAFYKSKTLWGIALAGVITIAQLFGVSVSDTLVAELVRIVGIILAAIGYRQAL